MNKFKTGLIALLAVIVSFSIIGLASVYAYDVEESTMCYGYSSSQLAPLGSTDAFLTTNEEAGVWVRIANPPDDVTFKFIKPDGTEYSSGYRRVDVIPKEGENWGIAFATLDIGGRTPSNNPGLWKVNVWIEGELNAVVEFNIIDYDELSSQISQITTIVDGIVAEKDQVLADYDVLQSSYEDLEQRYEDLEDSSVSETQLYEMNRKYDDLQDDYESLEDSQASTQSMMYAAIVVALVAVVVAVYFGVMKK